MPKLQRLMLAFLLLLCGSIAEAQTNDVKTTNWRCIIQVYELSKADASKLDLKLMPAAKSQSFEIFKANIDHKAIEWLDNHAIFISSSDTTLGLAQDSSMEWSIRNLKSDACRQKLTLERKSEATGFFHFSLSTSRQPSQANMKLDSYSFSSGLPMKEGNVALCTDGGHDSSCLVVVKFSPTESADEAVRSNVITVSGQGIRLPSVPLGSFKDE